MIISPTALFGTRNDVCVEDVTPDIEAMEEAEANTSGTEERALSLPQVRTGTGVSRLRRWGSRQRGERDNQAHGPDVLRAGALDGVIRLAFAVPGTTEAATRTDARVIETFAAGLAGSGKPLVISGETLVRPGRPATERDELIAGGPIAGVDHE
jgi:hypothetical protein